MTKQMGSYLNSPAGRKQFPGPKQQNRLMSRNELIAQKAGVDPNDPWMTSKGPGKKYSSQSPDRVLNPHHARTLAATRARGAANVSPHIAKMRQQGITNPRLAQMQDSMRQLGLTDKSIAATTKAFEQFAKSKGLQGEAYSNMVNRSIAQMQRRAGEGKLAGMLREDSPYYAAGKISRPRPLPQATPRGTPRGPVQTKTHG
jgi:hypothetical protein